MIQSTGAFAEHLTAKQNGPHGLIDQVVINTTLISSYPLGPFTCLYREVTQLLPLHLRLLALPLELQ